MSGHVGSEISKLNVFSKKKKLNTARGLLWYTMFMLIQFYKLKLYMHV